VIAPNTELFPTVPLEVELLAFAPPAPPAPTVTVIVEPTENPVDVKYPPAPPPPE
jgi:hypothetical protein